MLMFVKTTRQRDYKTTSLFSEELGVGSWELGVF